MYEEEAITTYPEALKAALFGGWEEPFTRTGYQGTGLQLMVFGFWMLCKDFAYLILRTILFFVFPLTALGILWAERKYIERKKAAIKQAEEHMFSNRQQNKEL